MAKVSTTTIQDGGKIVSGKAARVTESGSFQTGDNSTYTEAGGINLGSSARLNTGLEVGGGQNTITLNGGLSGDDLNKLVGNITQASTGQLNALQTALEKQADQVTQLVAAKDTGGATWYSNPLIWIAGGALVLIGVLFWKK